MDLSFPQIHHLLVKCYLDHLQHFGLHQVKKEFIKAITFPYKSRKEINLALKHLHIIYSCVLTKGKIYKGHCEKICSLFKL